MDRKLRCQIRKYKNDEEVLGLYDRYLNYLASEIYEIITDEEDVDRALEKVENFLKEKMFFDNYDYEINKEEKIIILKYDFEAPSFGAMDIHHKIIIKILPPLDENKGPIGELKKIINKIKNEDIYEIQANTEEGIIHSTLLMLDEKYDKIKQITGEKVKKILADFISYIIDYDKDYPGFAEGEEIMGYLGPERWSFEGNEKHLKLCYLYYAQYGAETRQFIETITFKKKNNLEIE